MSVMMLVGALPMTAMADALADNAVSSSVEGNPSPEIGEPTPEPTVEPTEEPTPEPTAEPTMEPTAEPTAVPTPVPSATSAPTAAPSAEPTVKPDSTAAPSASPQATPEQSALAKLAATQNAVAPTASHENQVRVIVENTTYSKANGAAWDGVLVDTWVSINQNSTMMSSVVAALEAGGHTQVGAESNYISEIDGLAAFAGGSGSGWMGTLNDWFTNLGFGSFTVANGNFEAGDEIRIMYTCDLGADLGGGWGDTNKAVKAIEFSSGRLAPDFDPATKEYTLTLPVEITELKVTPTAADKHNQVRASVGGTEYKRSSMIPVEDGTVITVKCGDPSWPGSDNTPAEVYTFTVSQASPNVNAVNKLIAELPDEDALTLNDEQAVNDCKRLYDALTEDEKKQVTGADKLDALVKRITILKTEAYYASTGSYLYTNNANPESDGYPYGEWALMALARSGISVREGYYDEYIASAVKRVQDNNGVLHSVKYEEYSKMILALTSVGYDVTDVGGYNLLEPLADFDKAAWRFLSATYALLAIDSHQYEIPAAADGAKQTTRENLIQFILDEMGSYGGASDEAGMAIQALAPYYGSNQAVKSAVDEYLAAVSSAQNKLGGYGGTDSVNASSCAQVLTALTALKIDPAKDERFIKDGKTIFDAINSCYVEGGGFNNGTGSKPQNLPTEQVYYALASYFRMLNGQTGLYDMTDVTLSIVTAEIPEITTQPSGAEYIVSAAPAGLKIAVKDVGDAGVLSYQWYSNTTESRENATAISGATKASYTPNKYTESNTTYYYCVVTNTVTKDSGKTVTATAESDIVKIQFKTMEEALADSGWQGNGTEESPYLLKTDKDLITLGGFVTNYKQTFANTYFKVEADITLPADWKVIGESTAFSGIFDGGGKTITFAYGSLPLFGKVANGTIKNLNISAPYINGCGLVNNYSVGFGTMAIDNVTIKSGSCIKNSGFLGGYASGGNAVTITNCKVEENVKIGYDAEAGASAGNTRVGSFGGDFNGTISNCVSYADVYGTDFVGGIVGGKGQTMGGFSVTGCEFYGTITATGEFVGGIAGSGYTGTNWGVGSAPNTPCAVIENCTVKAKVTGGTNVGGIFGGEKGSVQCWSNGIGSIKNNTFSGTVTAQNENGISGGIIGYMNSLDRYNEIEGNKFASNCGAPKGIGYVKYIDTSCETVDRSDETVVYFNTATGSGSTTIPSGAGRKDHNRTDDPIGADAGKLTEASGFSMNEECLSVSEVYEDGSAGDAVTLSYNDTTKTFSGDMSNFTEKPQYNASDLELALTGVPEGTEASFTLAGQTYAFENGKAGTGSDKPTKYMGTYEGILTLNINGVEQQYTLKLEKAVQAKWNKLDFSGTPEFNAEVIYHGAPEGTLFQLDENGERTGQTGLSENCFNYEVYVSAATESVKPAGGKALDIFKNSFSYPNYKASVYVDETPLFENVPTCMAMAMKWNQLADGVKLINNRTTLRVEFNINEKEVVNTTIHFVIKGTMDADYFIAALEGLNLEELVWPDDSSNIKKLYQNFLNLSDEEKAKIPQNLQEKLNKAYDLMRDDRVPSTLEIKKPASKLIYASGQKFDPAGAELLAAYDDGTTRTITEGFTVAPAEELTNETEVIFTYNTVSVKQPIKVMTLSLEGEGTQDKPYLLKTAENLQNLNDYVASGQSAEGKYFEMTADITLPDGWKPMGVTIDGTNNIQAGKNLYAFSGTIDGKNHTLTVPENGLPLLGYVKGAEVRNLNIFGKKIAGYGLVNNLEGVGLSGTSIIIDNVTLKSGSSTLKSGLLGANITTNGFAGCSAGFVATVRNCTIEEGVVIGYNKDQSMIGSIAGRMQGTVENCVSYATVYGGNYVGGIVGTRDNALGESGITNCEFGGVVEASGNHAGGILGGGYSNGTAPNGGRIPVIDCSSSGKITGKDKVGGIMGADTCVLQSWGPNTFENNKFTGTVKATDGKYVGGVIGYLGSLNKYDGFSANSYISTCGTEKGIGFVQYVDTSCETHETESGTIYFNSSVALPGVDGIIKMNHNRTDDPIGADAGKLTSVIEPEPVNQLPKLKDGVGSGSEASLLTGKEYSLDLSTIFEDADGDTLSYKVSVNGGKASAANVKYKYKADKAGKFTLVFTANDGKADSTDTYKVVINVSAVSDLYGATGKYLSEKVSNPVIASIGGEWAVIGLSRSGYPVDNGYYGRYISNVINTLKEENGILHDKKYTEYSRVVLALTSIGYDVTNVAGYNLLEPLADYDKVIWQGINGPIWALIAFDSHGYDIPSAPEGKKQATRENLIDRILDLELAAGGWTLSGSKTDADMTGMAIQALAPYYNSRADVKSAVDRGLEALSKMQNNEGGFGSWGTTNSESCTQVIVALATMGIDMDADERFIKNGKTVVDALMTYAVPGGGFGHESNAQVDGMATEQAYYALTAYYRLLGGKSSLYDMNDVTIDEAYKTVVKLIDAIGTVGLQSGDAIHAARIAYDTLTDSQKNQVTNYNLLTEAEKQYEKATVNIKKVQKLIDSIGTVTLASSQQIDQARKAYDGLTVAEKNYVANINTLTAAELRLGQLKNAEAVKNLIEKIGTVSKDSGSAIKAARSGYDALSREEKALVSNYSVLTAAERLYADLNRPPEPTPTVKPEGTPEPTVKPSPTPGNNATGGTHSIGNGSGNKNTGKSNVTVDGVKYNVSKEAVPVIESIADMPKDDNYDLNKVLAAYKAYAALTDEQKAEIVNYSDLEGLMNRAGVDNHEDKATGIKIEGVEWFVKMEAKKIDTSDDTFNKVEDSIGSNKLITLWDISLKDLLTGKEIQPDGKVKVRVPAPDKKGYESIMVVHYIDDGQVEYLDCMLENGEAIWEAESFSYYGLMGGAEEAKLTLKDEPDAVKTEGVKEPAEAAAAKPVEQNSLLWLWIVLACAGAAAIVIVVLVRTGKIGKKRNNE